MVASWPEPGPRDEEAEAETGAVIAAVRAIRNARAEYGVEPGRRIEARVSTGVHQATFAAQRSLLVSLARLDDARLALEASLSRPANALALVLPGVEVYLPLAGMIDVERERARLSKELTEAEAQIERTRSLLARPGFADKAPAEVVEREREKLANLEERHEKLVEQLQVLSE
jgi:valyl-tRNA synthetase